MFFAVCLDPKPCRVACRCGWFAFGGDPIFKRAFRSSVFVESSCRATLRPFSVPFFSPLGLFCRSLTAQFAGFARLRDRGLPFRGSAARSPTFRILSRPLLDGFNAFEEESGPPTAHANGIFAPPPLPPSLTTQLNSANPDAPHAYAHICIVVLLPLNSFFVRLIKRSQDAT